MFVMLAHGVSTGALFMLAGILYERRHTYEISEFGGLASVMPKYSTFFLFVVLASVGLPLLNGFIGEFLVLSGAFQAHMWWGVVGASGIIWSACYLLWVYQRVFFGVVKHEENLTVPDLNLRERVALWPAAIMALAMGVAPLLWLNAIDPAVHNALVPFTQFMSKVVSQ
jgi:NADH-quinone oxidoreductase subunit M